MTNMTGNANAPGVSLARAMVALECPDMPPQHPDTPSALDAVAHRDDGTKTGLPVHPVPLDRPGVLITTSDITEQLWRSSELQVEITWR
jgi:hypothetical protein